jgi:soluble lytic murein transglycosylase-like protein
VIVSGDEFTASRKMVLAVMAVLGVALLSAVLAVVLVVAALLLPPAHAATATAPVSMPPPQAARFRGPLVRAAHTQWGLQAPVAALAAQVHAESAWQPQAVSRVGAQGLAQFMPATAAWWCRTKGAEGADCLPHNPDWALRAMVGYDRWLFDRLAVAGAEPDRLWATMRSYNGGLGHWRDEARRAAGASRAAVDAACGSARRHPIHCPENLGYPRRILLQLQPRYSTWGRVVEVTP